jgi:signal transduction histidine kinase
VAEHRVVEAALVVGGGEPEEHRAPASELVQRRPFHAAQHDTGTVGGRRPSVATCGPGNPSGPIIVPMSWLGRLALPPGIGASGSALAGPAMTALRSAIARIAAIIRCVGMAYVVLQVIIWHPFFAADPWRLAGPAAAVLWAVAVVAYLRGHWPVWQLAALDSGVYVTLALAAGGCVPPATRGEAANWLFIAMTSQLVVPAWFAPTAVSVPLISASAAAYSASTLLAAGAVSGDSMPVATGALLLAAATIHWSGRQLLYRRATRADVALAAADRDARDQYVVLSRNIERREHERLLHDTVLNTLTALARGGSAEAAGVAGRCQHDVTLMEAALSDPGGLAAVTDKPFGGLLAGVAAVIAEQQARGLVIHFEVTSDVLAAASVPGENGIPRRSESEGTLIVPAAVACAIAHAVREALANVAVHAGTREAWVEVGLAAAGGEAAPGGEAAAPGGLQVTVRDSGAGFDPDRVDPARLGLRRSITERIADWGGWASIQSAPGEGTVVSLRWPAPTQLSQAAVAGHSSAQPGLPW